VQARLVYSTDPDINALATEIVCVLRYKRHYFMAQGLASDSVKEEFKEHADEEQEQADGSA